MLWATDHEGRVTLLQGKALELLGLNPTTAIGRPFAEVYGAFPRIVDEYRQAAAGEQLSSVVEMNELMFDVRYTPLRNEKNEMVGVIGVATDITERLLAEQELGRAAADLEQKNRQLSRANEFFRSTLEQITATVQRGAPERELLAYVEQASTQFKRLE